MVNLKNAAGPILDHKRARERCKKAVARLRDFRDPVSRNNRIISRSYSLSFDLHRTRQNPHVAVFGGKWSDHIEHVISPNLRQANTSYIVTDPGGLLLEKFGAYLNGRGYRVRAIRLDDPSLGSKYNPFAYIRNEEDLRALTDTIIANIPSSGPSDCPEYDSFLREYSLLCVLIAYVWQYFPEKERNFASVERLLHMAVSGGDEFYETLRIATRTEDQTKYFRGYKRYDFFTAQTPEKRRLAAMHLLTCLRVFFSREMKDMMSSDEAGLDILGDEFTALFVVTPTGAEYAPITAVIYTQVIHMMFHCCEDKTNHATVVDASGNVWKTFRGDSDAACRYFYVARNGRVVFDSESGMYNIVALDGRIVGWRSSKDRAEKALSELRDGTVITDSNYLPDDVNDKAHRSMDHLQELFGRERVMTKKPEYDIFIREHGLTSSVGQKNKTK